MSPDTRPTVYPSVRYRDPAAAIAWLERAFGFRCQALYEAPDGTVAHAQLEVGTGIVMSGTLSEDAVVPDRDGPHEPWGVYVAVDDPDAHHDRAVAAGARIVRPLTDQDYGSRDYSALDVEGRLWSFGTYRPAVGDPAVNDHAA